MNYKLLILFLLIQTYAFAQRTKPAIPTPPNCTWLYNNVFIDKTEIARTLLKLATIYSIKFLINTRNMVMNPFSIVPKKFLNFFTYGILQPESIYDRSNRPPRIDKLFSLLHENKVDRSAKQFSNARANGYGISNMIGNVAEMTLTKGIAKGGSWTRLLDNCKVSERNYYSTTTNWLGFRCVAEVTIR